MANIVLQFILKRNETIDKTINVLERSYDKLRARLDEYVKAGKQSAVIDIAQAQQDVERMLIDSGVYEALDLNEAYDDYLKNVQSLYEKNYGKKFRYSKVSARELTVLKTEQFNKFYRLTQTGKDAVAESVFNMRMGSMSLDDARAEVASTVEAGLQRYVNTWIETASASFSNTASTMLADDAGIKDFRYVGPDDKITRPFCRDHLDEVHTLEEWDAMDNHQINPVSIYRGGYNCRHMLIGVIEKTNRNEEQAGEVVV